MARFDSFACIDWSGAKGPLQRGLAVAVCEQGSAAPTLVAPPDRYWSRATVLDWLLQQADRGADMLIGLDLSLALPFVDAGAYFPGWDASPSSAKPLWQMVEELSAGDDHLAASGFIAHAEIARHFRQQGLCGDLFGTGRGRLRLCESGGQALIEGISPYSCFNLVGAAQVGKSSLTGMRVLHRLGSAIPIWPFDPLPSSGPVIVEIYTSIAARTAAVLPKGRSKIVDGDTLDRVLAQFGSDPHLPLVQGYNDHATDALLTAAWLRLIGNEARYWHPSKLDSHVALTEGWTFGVL